MLLHFVVLTRQVERLRIELLEESNRRKALEDLQHDILDGSQDLVQEKDGTKFRGKPLKE